MDNTYKVTYSKDLSKLRGVKLSALNIRNICNKVIDIEILLHQSGLDYLGLCETWMASDIDSEVLNVHGYDVHRLDRTTVLDKKGGGLLAYCSKKYNSCHLPDWNLITPDVGWAWMRLDLKAT